MWGEVLVSPLLHIYASLFFFCSFQGICVLKGKSTGKLSFRGWKMKFRGSLNSFYFFWRPLILWEKSPQSSYHVLLSCCLWGNMEEDYSQIVIKMEGLSSKFVMEWKKVGGVWLRCSQILSSFIFSWAVLVLLSAYPGRPIKVILSGLKSVFIWK